LIKKRKLHTAIFIVTDSLAAALAWIAFFAYRKYFIEPAKFGYQIPIELDNNFFIALLIIPAYWALLYYFSGHYKQVWHRSRIEELSKVFSSTLIGVLLIFFALLLDDEVKNYQSYYKTTITLFMLHYSLTVVVRIIQTSFVIKSLKKNKIGFNTIVVGNNVRSLNLIKELMKPNAQGFIIRGFVTVNGDEQEHILKDLIPLLGNYSLLPELIAKHEIEEIIIGIESSKHIDLNNVTNLLEDQKVSLKIIPDLYDMVSGQVKLNNVIGTALIAVNHDVMPLWQKAAKRIIDIVVSLVMLFLCSPILVIIAPAVKVSSTGPIFFKQIRLGYKGKPFYIYKFRTMYVNAEDSGPQLSSKNDKRITNFGKILRKYRLDEIPQFFNVLIGNMSLVGPRPERKFFVDKIIKIAPHYKHLHRVKPGITSWGQVKYGYAENVEQMVERLQYDILYIENRSIAVDFRILIYTLKTILQGAGR